ncbi:MAG: 4Fe-4S binding protein [Betaproteobacteria bacterium]|nr:4Fe-4S binding protein [Betaproteobacteria bacterium]
MAMKIDPDMCTACGDCKDVCPTQSITAGKIYFKIAAATCAECDGHNDTPLCADVCSAGCIGPA